MKKKIILFIKILILVNLSTFSQSSEQQCITSEGVPNHEIGKFPTKGNPNIFKKQKLKFCFTKNPKKKNIVIAIRISRMFTPDIPLFQTSKNKSLNFSKALIFYNCLILIFHLQD